MRRGKERTGYMKENINDFRERCRRETEEDCREMRLMWV